MVQSEARCPGTMNARDLAVKFISYASYFASCEWASECSMLPVLVCVAPDIAQERRMQRVAQARLTQSAGLVVNAIIKEGHLNIWGILPA